MQLTWHLHKKRYICMMRVHGGITVDTVQYHLAHIKQMTAAVVVVVTCNNTLLLLFIYLFMFLCVCICVKADMEMGCNTQQQQQYGTTQPTTTYGLNAVSKACAVCSKFKLFEEFGKHLDVMAAARFVLDQILNRSTRIISFLFQFFYIFSRFVNCAYRLLLQLSFQKWNCTFQLFFFFKKKESLSLN